MTIFETLIGGLETTAGNHRCMLPDGGGVPGGQGCIPPAPGCAVRRQAPAVAGTAWGLQGPRCPAWLVHACIVVSLGGWRAPEEARAIWRGGRRDGCSPKEGFPGSSRLQHALMPMRAHYVNTYLCTTRILTHGSADRDITSSAALPRNCQRRENSSAVDTNPALRYRGHAEDSCACACVLAHNGRPPSSFRRSSDFACWR
jgi:hypothetical protein